MSKVEQKSDKILEILKDSINRLSANENLEQNKIAGRLVEVLKAWIQVQEAIKAIAEIQCPNYNPRCHCHGIRRDIIHKLKAIGESK